MKPNQISARGQAIATVPFVVSMLLFLACSDAILAQQQQHVQFGYDASGNRISRTIVLQKMADAVIDTTEADCTLLPEAVFTECLSEAVIRIYPNPTKGKLTIQITGRAEHEKTMLSLYDMQGRFLFTKSGEGEYSEADLSAQPSGSYMLRIETGKESTAWKIIKE